MKRKHLLEALRAQAGERLEHAVVAGNLGVADYWGFLCWSCLPSLAQVILLPIGSNQHRGSRHGRGHDGDPLPNQNRRRERSPERLSPPAKAPATAGTARSPELGRQFAGIAKIRAGACPAPTPTQQTDGRD